MTANAEIVLEEHPNALIVPEAAITYDAKRKLSASLRCAAGRPAAGERQRLGAEGDKCAP